MRGFVRPLSYAGTMTTYSAHDVAVEIRARIPGVGAKKLHKLLYYCQGYHVAAFDTPLFGENIDAWDMGPVVAQLWRDEKHGSLLIFGPDDGQPLDEAALNTIGYVVDRYGGLTGADLEAMTHREAPWIEADTARKTGRSDNIPLGTLVEWFKPRQPADDAADHDLPPIDEAALREWLDQTARTRISELGSDDLAVLRARASR